MSEFQLYQFKSIDRPLTEAERKEIGSWSSRTQPTATSATFTYSYGDFPKNAEKVVEKYFDAMLYASNWGTRRLMFRLPKNLVDYQSLSAYGFDNEWVEDHISVEKHETCYLLDIYFNNEEGGNWLDEDDFDINDFASLRDDILEGDYRAVYLLWMHFAQGLPDENEEEEEFVSPAPPPIPGRAFKLSGALKGLIEFFEIDRDLVAAVQAAGTLADDNSEPDILAGIKKLPEKERLDWLSRLAQNEPNLSLAFKRRLMETIPRREQTQTKGPSVKEINALSEAKTAERRQREAEEAGKAHIQMMEELVGKEFELWEQVHENLLKANAPAYDKAVGTLQTLKDLAVYKDWEEAFNAEMQRLKEECSRKYTLLERFKKAGL